MQISNSTFHGLHVFSCACLCFCCPPAVFLPVCSFILLIAFILAYPSHLALHAGLWFCAAVGCSVIGLCPAPTKCCRFLWQEDELRMSFTVPRMIYFALSAKAHTNLKCCLCSAFNNNDDDRKSHMLLGPS